MSNTVPMQPVRKDWQIAEEALGYFKNKIATAVPRAAMAGLSLVAFSTDVLAKIQSDNNVAPLHPAAAISMEIVEAKATHVSPDFNAALPLRPQDRAKGITAITFEA